MGYAPFPFSDWGGLDIRNEADEANGAIDLLNVDLDRVGATRTRNGYSLVNSVANPVAFSNSGPFVWRAQGLILASAGDLKVYVYNAAGSLLYTSGAYSSDVTSVAEFGTGTTSYLYLAQKAAGTIIRLTSAGTFSSPAGMPTANFLAVQPSDNRLVAAGLATNTSRVQFSDPGDAETWGANNYVDLHPNDGQTVTGAVAWDNQVFVFKDRKFFVFYGNSTDGSGNPIFNYRAVDTGVGSMSGSAVATPDGVYFFSPDGIYKTTGGPPVKVSRDLDPLFSDAGSPYCAVSQPLGHPPFNTPTFSRGRVYFDVTDQAGVRSILVYDVAGGYWLIWRPSHSSVAPTAGLATILVASSYERVIFATGTRFYSFDNTSTSDAGAGITGRYRSPYVNLNYIRRQRKWYPITSQEGTVRETILDGTGTVGYSLARDWATSLPTTGGGRKGIVKLGASVPAQGRHRYAQRGRAMSFQLETPTASDSFGSNTIANYTADLGATTNVSITGGVMDAAANFSTQNELILTTGTFTDFGDSVSTVKINVGATRTNFLAGRLLKRVAANSRVAVYLFDDGAASTLRIATTASGLVSTTALTRISASTSYWIRARIEGNVITAEFFTADPASNVAANVAANTGTYTLTGANATTYGSGIVGKTGLVFAPQETTASLDDSSVIGGAWKVEDLVWHLTGVRQSGVETT